MIRSSQWGGDVHPPGTAYWPVAPKKGHGLKALDAIYKIYTFLHRKNISATVRQFFGVFDVTKKFAFSNFVAIFADFNEIY